MKYFEMKGDHKLHQSAFLRIVWQHGWAAGSKMCDKHRVGYLSLTASTLLLPSKTHRLQRTNPPGGALQSRWRGQREHKAEEIRGLRGGSRRRRWKDTHQTMQQWKNDEKSEIKHSSDVLIHYSFFMLDDCHELRLDLSPAVCILPVFSLAWVSLPACLTVESCLLRWQKAQIIKVGVQRTFSACRNPLLWFGTCLFPAPSLRRGPTERWTQARWFYTRTTLL